METSGNGPNRRIPEATVARLPLYLRSLLEISERGVRTVSSEGLAGSTGVNAAKVRKDLSYLGSYGTRGVGYDVDYLVYQISVQLGLNREWPAAIVGLGNLGRALANYRGFSQRGFRIAALFDADAKTVGQEIAGLPVHHVDTLEDVMGDLHVAIGIVATPASAAQEVADRLVGGGVAAILNFAPTVLQVPEHVALRKVDLSIELQILAFYIGRDEALAELDAEA